MRNAQLSLTTGAAVADPACLPMERVFAGRADRLAEVRGYVAGCLGDAGCPQLVDDAVLCVDELFANAVRHTRSGLPGGSVFVRVEVSPGPCVVCHVHDQGGSTVPAPRSPDQIREGGRGLPIVAALASTCGGTDVCACGPPLRGGCCVWFRLQREVSR